MTALAQASAQAPAPAGPGAGEDFEGLKGFEDRSAAGFACAIMGDLHLEPGHQMKLFEEARRQLVGAITEDAAAVPRVVQLGDLGGYKFRPGSRECFARGREFLAGFGVPTTLVTGNHDLEGDEFETDEENLAAWQELFRQRHYWAAEVGPATFIGLSTVRFRSNPYSVHEVHVDEEQLAFFRAELEKAAAANRPVVMFTHAPILGSGLKVVQTVHVKNRCAWLNHSSNPHAFIELVQQYPNIRLWFSGHFHLSHNYADAISVVGGTAFVLTGVIGECNRDGFRQSRLLKGTQDGYELYTVDHESGSLRLDLAHRWDDFSAPQLLNREAELRPPTPEVALACPLLPSSQAALTEPPAARWNPTSPQPLPPPLEPLTPEEELICDPSAGWLCSKVDCSLGGEVEPTLQDLAPTITWLNAGPSCMLAVQDDIIVEYDTRSMSPIGLVCMDMPDDCTARLVDAAGNEVDALNTDGSAAVALEVLSADGELHQRIKRNHVGTFFQVYQHNKWVARKKKEAEEAAARQRAAGAAGAAAAATQQQAAVGAQR